jgi:hypothetical protein
MTPCDSHEASVANLERLVVLAPDPDRAERVRMRCRTELGRSRQRAARTAAITRFTWQVLAPAVVGGFCVVYAALLVTTTLRLQGVFH